MEVKIAGSYEACFEKIEVGETFMQDDEFFIKIEIPDRTNDYAVNLETGLCKAFSRLDIVRKIPAIITIGG